jgi:hypothetical protein
LELVLGLKGTTRLMNPLRMLLVGAREKSDGAWLQISEKSRIISCLHLAEFSEVNKLYSIIKYLYK